jgi:hypothetical protein
VTFFDPADVVWPAVLQCAGQARLFLVETEDEWVLDPAFHSRTYGPDDRLIDSAGAQYRPTSSAGARADLEYFGIICAPAEFQEIAERHLEAVGAPPEWLAPHLEGIPESAWVRAAIRYLTRFEGDGGDDASAEEEE